MAQNRVFFNQKFQGKQYGIFKAYFDGRGVVMSIDRGNAEGGVLAVVTLRPRVNLVTMDQPASSSGALAAARALGDFSL